MKRTKKPRSRHLKKTRKGGVSPRRSHSKSPRRRHSKSPRRSHSRSPHRRHSRSPRRSRSRSPHRSLTNEERDLNILAMKIKEFPRDKHAHHKELDNIQERYNLSFTDPFTLFLF